MAIPEGMKRDVQSLAHIELDRSNTIFGNFNSHHEAFGVIVEERNEARESIEAVYHAIEIIEKKLRGDMPAPQLYECLYHNAIDAACELIQVAAMGLKGASMAEEKGGQA